MDNLDKAFAEADRLLKAGDVQGASDLLEKYRAQAKAEYDAKLGIPPEPEPPRAPGVILIDFMRVVAMRFGHHRELTLLVDEMARAVEKESGAAEDPKPTE